MSGHASLAAPRTGGSASSEWRKGWRPVLGAGIGYGTGGAMILLLGSLFIKPMREDLGWSASAVTIMPVISLVWALCNPMAGAAIDRFGSRPLGIIGMVGLGLSTLLLALVPITMALLFGIAALMGVFASLTSVATYSRGVASWFNRGLGLALGIALSGSAVVAVLATPLIGGIIASYGWRAGYLGLSAIILIIALPIVVLLYREQPAAAQPGEPRAEIAGLELAEALRDGRFWCYVASFTLASMVLSGTATHLQPLVAEAGIPLYRALSLGMVFAAAISLGKIVGGVLLDHLWPFAVAAIILLIACAGALALTSLDVGTAYLVLLLSVGAIGLAAGAEADFVGYFIIRSFGRRRFSTIVGVVAMIVTLGNAVGGWLYGFLFDTYGSYSPATLAGAAFLLCATALMLLAGLIEMRANREFGIVSVQ